MCCTKQSLLQSAVLAVLTTSPAYLKLVLWYQDVGARKQMKWDVPVVSEAVDALFFWMRSVIRKQEDGGVVS